MTIAIHLKAAKDVTGGVPCILSLADDSGTELLYLGQWKQSLIVRWFNPEQGSRRKLREIGVGRAFSKNQARWLIIASNQAGTTISVKGPAFGSPLARGPKSTGEYCGNGPPGKPGAPAAVEGETAKRFPEKALLAEGRSIRGLRVVLGNSAEAKKPWTGSILALALYEGFLDEREAFQGWSQEKESDRNSNISEKGLMAAFDFEGGEEGRASDLSGNGNALVVPERIIALKQRILSWPNTSLQTGASLVEDAVLNFVGFVPFGFVFLSWLKSAKRWNRGRSQLFVFLMGGLMSVGIEVTQAFMPARDSSLADVLWNTTGTLLGVMVFRFVDSSKMKRLNQEN